MVWRFRDASGPPARLAAARVRGGREGGPGSAPPASAYVPASPVVEITSAIITEKKFARLPLVMRKTRKTNTEAMTPETMLTAIGVPTLAKRPIQARAVPSSAAMA
jgi:hypothetical protein